MGGFVGSVGGCGVCALVGVTCVVVAGRWCGGWGVWIVWKEWTCQLACCTAVDVTAAEVAVAGGCSLNNAGIVLIARMVWMRQLAAMGPYAYSDAWTH